MFHSAPMIVTGYITLRIPCFTFHQLLKHEPVNLSDTVSICGGLGGDVKCVYITRNVRFANVTVNVAVRAPSSWGWGTIVDVKIASNITVSYNYPDVGGIEAWRIREKLTPHPQRSMA